MRICLHRRLVQHDAHAFESGLPITGAIWGHFKIRVESRGGAVVLGYACLLPPLSVGGAQVA